MRPNVYVLLYVAPWCILALCHWDILILVIIPTSGCCSPLGQLCYWPVVLLFDCGHPCFRNFNSAVIINEEAIHIKLYPNNINRESGTEISDAWMATVKMHYSRSVTKLTYERITPASRNNNEDRNASKTERHNVAMTKHQSTTHSDI